jgi:hypothetical protein
MTDWEYFEKLPPRLRAALAGAAFEYKSDQFYDAIQMGFSVDRMIRHVRDCDIQYAMAAIGSKIGDQTFIQTSVTDATGVKPLYR